MSIRADQVEYTSGKTENLNGGILGSTGAINYVNQSSSFPDPTTGSGQFAHKEGKLLFGHITGVKTIMNADGTIPGTGEGSGEAVYGSNILFSLSQSFNITATTSYSTIVPGSNINGVFEIPTGTEVGDSLGAQIALSTFETDRVASIAIKTGATTLLEITDVDVIAGATKPESSLLCNIVLSRTNSNKLLISINITSGGTAGYVAYNSISESTVDYSSDIPLDVQIKVGTGTTTAVVEYINLISYKASESLSASLPDIITEVTTQTMLKTSLNTKGLVTGRTPAVANDLSVVTSSFGKNLTASEDTVQKALDKLDDLVTSSLAVSLSTTIAKNTIHYVAGNGNYTLPNLASCVNGDVVSLIFDHSTGYSDSVGASIFSNISGSIKWPATVFGTISGNSVPTVSSSGINTYRRWWIPDTNGGTTYQRWYKRTVWSVDFVVMTISSTKWWIPKINQTEYFEF